MSELKFEQALSQLEQIVQKLERGDLTLEDALQMFEKGVQLSSVCLKRLNEAEKKIQQLIKIKDEKFKLVSIDLPTEEQ